MDDWLNKTCSDKKGQTIDTCNNLGGYQEYYDDPPPKSILNGHKLYKSIYIIFLEWKNYVENESVVPGIRDGVGAGRMGVGLLRVGQGDLCGDWIVLYLDSHGGYVNLHVIR